MTFVKKLRLFDYKEENLFIPHLFRFATGWPIVKIIATQNSFKYIYRLPNINR